MATSQDFATWTCRPPLLSRYLLWALRGTIKDIVATTMGSTHQTIYMPNIEQIKVPLPPRAAQERIADFLDAETARLDRLIEMKQRLVELLAHRFQAAVTRKLFGASGRWTRLGRAVDLLPGFAFSSESFSEEPNGNVRLLRGINIAPGHVRWDETVFVDASLARGAKRFLLAAGDLVVGMDRPFIGGGMRVAQISEDDLPCLLVQRVARLRANELAEADWIRLALMTPTFVAYFTPIVTGVSVPHISPDQIEGFKLPLPGRQEQRAILRELLSIEEKGVRLSRAVDAQIGLLRERRQTLITAAVTGKLHVAKAAA